jgi:ribosomal protein S18 acetylase RimI-like enzyme
MIIKEISQVTPALIEAFQKLITQLSSSASAPSRQDLEEIVTNPGAILFVAEEGEKILGSLTLIFFRIPVGMRGRIEDVVVDETARGKGIGSALILSAIEKANTMNVQVIDLTSKPDREAANRLYQNLGFVKKDTNVYRYKFD